MQQTNHSGAFIGSAAIQTQGFTKHKATSI
jgi:hypothetical protein